MSEQYFLVRKLGLGKEMVSLSLVVTEVSAEKMQLRSEDCSLPILLIASKSKSWPATN